VLRYLGRASSDDAAHACPLTHRVGVAAFSPESEGVLGCCISAPASGVIHSWLLTAVCGWPKAPSTAIFTPRSVGAVVPVPCSPPGSADSQHPSQTDHTTINDTPIHWLIPLLFNPAWLYSHIVDPTLLSFVFAEFRLLFPRIGQAPNWVSAAVQPYGLSKASLFIFCLFTNRVRAHSNRRSEPSLLRSNQNQTHQYDDPSFVVARKFFIKRVAPLHCDVPAHRPAFCLSCHCLLRFDLPPSQALLLLLFPSPSRTISFGYVTVEVIRLSGPPFLHRISYSNRLDAEALAARPQLRS